MQALMAFAVAEAEAAAALGDGSAETAPQMLPMAQVREGRYHYPEGRSLVRHSTFLRLRGFRSLRFHMSSVEWRQGSAQKEGCCMQQCHCMLIISYG